MAKNLLNKYVWLVETIYKAKKISYEEISRRWEDNDMSEGKELPKRTFHNWRQQIEELFGLIIENENSGQYRFFIQNADDLLLVNSQEDLQFLLQLPFGVAPVELGFNSERIQHSLVQPPWRQLGIREINREIILLWQILHKLTDQR